MATAEKTVVKAASALVTGADGFIGSHLTEMLLDKGYKVRALCQYNSLGTWGWLEGLAHERLEVVSGDVRDPALCQVILENIDYVFHLAALIAIPYSYLAPDSYVATNVTGTLNMCQAARQRGCLRFIQTSTSEVYGTARYVPINEAHPLQPQSPYSASKIGADAVAMSFYHSFDLPVTVARPFNTYGPRQSARAVIPTIIGQILSGRKTIKLGDVSPTRDFTYVRDTCRGFLALAEHSESCGQIVNIGSNFEISIGEILEKIKALMNSDVEFLVEEQRLRPKDSEVFRLWCDNTKIREMTGFEPQYSIEDGLMRTIEWFRNPNSLSKSKMDIYNV